MTGLLFVVGSALFALGVLLSLPPALPPLLSAVTYTIGAMFFTGAAFFQLVLAQRELPESERRSLPSRARTTDWMAAAIQLVGTVLFNINTMDAALAIGARPEVVDLEVWVPDILGSVAFLVSSAIAMVPEVRARRHSHVADTSQRIAFLNVAGSVLFGASAVGALVLRSGTDVSLVWANLGTFFGAVCFLAAARLFGWPAPAARRGRGGQLSRKATQHLFPHARPGQTSGQSAGPAAAGRGYAVADDDDSHHWASAGVQPTDASGRQG